MDELFGAPIGAIAIVLAVAFAIIVGFLAFIAWRDPILVRMAVRNVSRRPARGMLIVVGLMLATAIISSAFTAGDSITFSIKRSAVDSLRALDELVRVDEDSDVWKGKALPEEFSEEVYDQLGPLFKADPDVDGVLPVLVEDVAVIAMRSRQFTAEGLFTGLDPAQAAEFESLSDLDGNPVDLASLGPDEVYIDREGAEEIGAVAGDVLGVALGPGDLKQVTVKAIVDGWYSKKSNTKAVLMVSLARAQELLDKPGQITYILISNRGDALEGEELTPRIIEKFGDLPDLREAGLEVYDLKRDVVKQANEIGSLFVSFFTTFGLFSIGVGLLLIFLIFSMLAAERKSEMGMSRAIGMQRRHLVRLFMAEGAIYSLGSALIGAIAGVGLGFLLVLVTGDSFNEDPTEEFSVTAHVEALSVLVSFLVGSVITFVTVVFAARRISRLNIVRAIRDIPEPQLARAGRKALIWGIIITVAGALVLFVGYQSAQLTAFGLGVSLVTVGLALILRWKGVAQRLVLSGTGLFLVVYWLLPPSVYNSIREDWNQDFSIFFLSGALVVTGAVLVTVNNSSTIIGLISGSVGRFRSLAPVIKSAVAYPLRFGFRTGLSLAMFAVVVFSVTTMATIIEGFNKLFDDQRRLGGGYEVFAFAQSDLNPIPDLRAAVESNPELDIVERVDGAPSVGTFRSFGQASARLTELEDSELRDTVVTGVDDDFVASTEFRIRLATAKYATDSGFDSGAVWRALRDSPGLAVVNAFMVPTRNGFAFNIASDAFALDEIEDLYIENETLDPVKVTVHDLKEGTEFELTVIGVLDPFASEGPLPSGFFTSTNTLAAELAREVKPSRYFFNLRPGTEDGAGTIESALFQHGIETIDVAETIADFQASQRSFFNLLIGFMTLGLVVGIAALGVISARAVVERRHEIGVLRAIGYSRRMVQMSFLAESSFIALLGIGLGVALGLLMSINIIADIRADEPDIELIIPWATMGVIVAGAYLFSLLTTYLPSRQASRIAPAEALRYE